MICAGAVLGVRVSIKVPAVGDETLAELGFLWLAANIAPDAAREAGLSRSIAKATGEQGAVGRAGVEPATNGL